MRHPRTRSWKRGRTLKERSRNSGLESSSTEETSMQAQVIGRASTFLSRSARVVPVLFAWASGCAWADCSSQSGNPQLHLVELYSSEGCNSCPPAEQWLSTLSKHAEL